MNNPTLLTQKQKDVLFFIYSQVRSRNIAPTIREIASHFGFSSTGTVRDYLRALTTKGYIRVAEGKSRAIELIREAICQIPVLGRVQAGSPIYAVEDLMGYLNLDKIIFPEPDMFALKVKGDSMIEAGIMPDDFAIIKRQEFAKVGDIVVAMIGEEATIKRLIKKGEKYYLNPANPRYEPISVTENVTIIGKLINVVREY
ncbi:MAG: transcriptional repressor LexA [Candidatus Omnitrophica bacterium]|nr:transcriptional repressor LexA [Candidatus Omnitrophota bacterium]